MVDLQKFKEQTLSSMAEEKENFMKQLDQSEADLKEHANRRIFSKINEPILDEH